MSQPRPQQERCVCEQGPQDHPWVGWCGCGCHGRSGIFVCQDGFVLPPGIAGYVSEGPVRGPWRVNEWPAHE